ncbi:hypothetical protein chiPu_0031971, partial [Chiloscyllium punctatum]|nr:hypothetical protein [Chiloscyllium punctatum]
MTRRNLLHHRGMVRRRRLRAQRGLGRADHQRERDRDQDEDHHQLVVVRERDDLRLCRHHPVGHRAAGIGVEVDHARYVGHLQRVVERVDLLGELGVDPPPRFSELRDHDRDADR